MWMIKAVIRAISIILIAGNVAMKCAALLKGSGSLFSSIRLIVRWTGRNNNRKTPARAMTNFLEMEENRTLFIDN
jgi:hypothetical protein